MTTKSLPLQGSLQRPMIWLAILALGVPGAIIVSTFWIAYSRHPAPPVVAFAPLFALVVVALVFWWIVWTIRRIAVTLDADTLTVASGVGTRRFALSALRAGGIRTVNLAEHVDLKPILRTWGIGLPGLSSGWFRLRNRGKALCVLTARERVTVLRNDDGTWILLSLADPSPLRAAFGA